MKITEIVTCREGHTFEAEFDFEREGYRILTEPERWHDVAQIIDFGGVPVTEKIPWCCSRQAYMTYMKHLKAMNRKPPARDGK